MKTYLLLLAMLIFSSTNTCNDQLLEQIQVLHLQNTELEKETAGIIDSLVQIRNRINIQGRALTEEELARVGSIDALEQRWQDWETGFQAITPSTVAKKERKSVLETQQALQQSLQALKIEAEALLKN
ncbi:MAG: hypothetical protein IPL49_01180 [Saprospirales bacterium]|nr:hypothetical protein [Saprospirales bacterium]MBK8489531.1 hypothetical protein [Saprospirales bacterium]